MDFTLSKSQKLLIDSVRKFTEREVTPRAGEMERSGALPDDLIQKMARMGLLGINLPERYGGSQATVSEDGQYVVNGMKRFSTFGNRDGFAILFARDESQRCTAFLIDKKAPGYTCTANYPLMGSDGCWPKCMPHCKPVAGSPIMPRT